MHVEYRVGLFIDHATNERFAIKEVPLVGASNVQVCM